MAPKRKPKNEIKHKRTIYLTLDQIAVVQRMADADEREFGTVLRMLVRDALERRRKVRKVA